MTDYTNTKLMVLSQGKFAIVDADDYEWLSQWKWTLTVHGYASRPDRYRDENNKRKQHAIWMHRFIMGTPKGM